MLLVIEKNDLSLQTVTVKKIMEAKSEKWSESTKLAEIVEADYNLLFVMSRFGIRLGFGDRNIAEVCRQYNLSPKLFLLVCRVYSIPNYRPVTDNLSRADLPNIIKYLHNSHTYYTESCFPNLDAKVRKVTERCEERNRKVLLQFFNDYRHEVDIHFGYEEQTVMPYIEQLLDGRKSDYSIMQFEDNHGDIQEKLGDLKNIIIKYLPDDGESDLRYDLILSILKLEDDFAKHTLIEDRVLVPLALKLEHDE